MVISSVRDLFFLPLSLPWPSLLPAPLGFLLEACFNLYSLGMANKSTLNEAVSLSRTFDTPFLQTPWCPPDSQPTYLSICLKAHFSQCRGEVGHALHIYISLPSASWQWETSCSHGCQDFALGIEESPLMIGHFSTLSCL